MIAREKESAIMAECMQTEKSEFVVVCGRRRVGKTYFVENYFRHKFDFRYVGGHNLRMRDQLRNFGKALKKYSKRPIPELKDWFEAFDALIAYLESLPTRRKRVVFIDEMPWMDSRRSNFVSALEYFWNSWANSQGNILFVATGSATSWMTDKLMKNKGGLHNRVTRRLYIQPFTLRETEQYFQKQHASWGRFEMLQLYMLTGGVPFYLDMIDPKETVAQNIDRLCFDKGGALRIEFDELYSALFASAESYVSVVRVLSLHREGMTHKEISEAVSLNGANLTRILVNLEKCNFIGKQSLFGNKRREAVFRLTDFYTLFYFKFVEHDHTKDSQWWTHHLDSGLVSQWQGVTFELICMAHHEQIKRALGISGMATSISSWRCHPDSKRDLPGGQIDMLIERADRRIHLCEMKFSQGTYHITADYEKKLRDRMSLFNLRTGNRLPLVHTFVTTYGVGEGKHHSIVHSEVTMDALFQS